MLSNDISTAKSCWLLNPKNAQWSGEITGGSFGNVAYIWLPFIALCCVPGRGESCPASLGLAVTCLGQSPSNMSLTLGLVTVHSLDVKQEECTLLLQAHSPLWHIVQRSLSSDQRGSSATSVP